MNHLTTIAALPGFGNGLAAAMRKELSPSDAEQARGTSVFDQMAQGLVLELSSAAGKTGAAKAKRKPLDPETFDQAIEIGLQSGLTREELREHAGQNLTHSAKSTAQAITDSLNWMYTAPSHEHGPEHRVASPIDVIGHRAPRRLAVSKDSECPLQRAHFDLLVERLCSGHEFTPMAGRSAAYYRWDLGSDPSNEVPEGAQRTDPGMRDYVVYGFVAEGIDVRAEVAVIDAFDELLTELARRCGVMGSLHAPFLVVRRGLTLTRTETERGDGYTKLTMRVDLPQLPVRPEDLRRVEGHMHDGHPINKVG